MVGAPSVNGQLFRFVPVGRRCIKLTVSRQQWGCSRLRGDGHVQEIACNHERLHVDDHALDPGSRVFRARSTEDARMVWGLRLLGHDGLLHPPDAYSCGVCISRDFSGVLRGDRSDSRIAHTHRRLRDWLRDARSRDDGQKGEGIEYHLLAIAIALALLVRGGGALSLDKALAR